MRPQIVSFLSLVAIAPNCLGQEAGYTALFEAENKETITFSMDEDGFFSATRHDADGETSVGLTNYSRKGMECWGFASIGCVIAKLDHCRYSEFSGSFSELSYRCAIPNSDDSQEQTVTISSSPEFFEEEEAIVIRVLSYDRSGTLERFSEISANGKIVKTFRLVSKDTGSSRSPH